MYIYIYIYIYIYREIGRRRTYFLRLPRRDAARDRAGQIHISIKHINNRFLGQVWFSLSLSMGTRFGQNIKVFELLPSMWILPVLREAV